MLFSIGINQFIPACNFAPKIIINADLILGRTLLWSSFLKSATFFKVINNIYKNNVLYALLLLLVSILYYS